MTRPPVVTPQEWSQARADLLIAEKEATHRLDELAARRRRLPMVAFATDYTFEGPNGPMTLLDLFDGREELMVYQFMDVGPDGLCPGCTNLTNNVVALPMLADAGISWATVSDMPFAQIARATAHHGWTMPFVSSRGTSFSADCGAGGGFLLSAFVRFADDVFRTYSTTSRGVDRLLFVNNVQDLSVFGRREDWEDSPAGWPQHPTYG